MKVGILTFHFGINYGAVIQALALSRQLRKIGHYVQVVNYEPWASRWPWLLVMLKNGMKDGFRRFRLELPFRWFRVRYLNQTRRIHKLSQLAGAGFDAVVVGSDQVWNPIYSCSREGIFNTVYFLEGLPSNCCRLSYAASMGEADWGGHWPKVRELLSHFSGISVREGYAQKVLTEQGVPNVELVPDPSIFLAASDLDEIIGNGRFPPAAGRRLFVYGLGEAERCVTELAHALEGETDVARVVVMRTCTHLQDCRITYIHPDPVGWLAEIRAADFIITDSFHCMMIALAYHRPFRMIYKTLEPMTNDRMLTTLKIAGIEDTEHPDWVTVDRRLSEYRAKGLAFLERCLGSESGN